MKKFYFTLLFVSLLVSASMDVVNAQSVFNPNDPIINYNSETPPKTPPYNTVGKWVRTPTFSWNTSLWKAYYYNGMAFRMIYPSSYDASSDKKYPLLIFFHGAGEAGSIYNNELQLANCARKIQSAVMSGSFDAFVIFPQSPFRGWVGNQFVTIKGFVDSLIKEARVDQNRIIVSGLSSGGDGTWRFTEEYPKLVAAAVPISASTAAEAQSDFVQTIQDIPIWLSQGGRDDRPTPEMTNYVVSQFLAAGMDMQTLEPSQEGIIPFSESYYIIYPDKGHNTWDAHYNEPMAFEFMINAYKSNPHVYFGRRKYCVGDTIHSKLELTPGFDAYQWSRNGVLLAGDTLNYLIVRDTGVYRARILNNGEWSEWSPSPVHIMYNTATKTPPIQISGLMSRVIPAPDGHTSVNLMLPEGYASYQWKNESGELVGTNNIFTATQPGKYFAIVMEKNGCLALHSDTFSVASNSGPTPPDPATNLTGYAQSQTSIVLHWRQNIHAENNETNFEVYRSKETGGPYKLVGVVPTDTLWFIDKNLSPNTTYFYGVRAVNLTGASPLSLEDSITTLVDIEAPTAPRNLVKTGASDHSVNLKWNASTDNISVAGYYVYINGVRTHVTKDTSFSVNNLKYKQYYVFTVKAVDSSGNISTSSNQVVASAITSGLTYKFYTYTGHWTSLPDLDDLPVEESNTVRNITLDPATQETYFAFSFKGFLNVRKAGTYTFYTESDDGSNLYINNTQIVNNDGLHGSTRKSGQYTFSQPGLYTFRVTYYQEGGGASLSTYWEADALGIPFSRIPDSAFAESNSSGGTAPAKPTSLNATASSYHNIQLNWTDNSSDEDGFEVYRAVKTDGPWQIVYTAKADSTSFIDSSLNASTTYYYKIQAINAHGQSGFGEDETVHATTQPLPPAPPAPSGLTAIAISPNQINLAWNSMENVSSFDIYRSDGHNTAFVQLDHIPGNITSYADSTLFSNTTYYYKVTASNIGGVSPYSIEKQAITLDHLPVLAPFADQQYIRYGDTTRILVKVQDGYMDTVSFYVKNLPPFGTFTDKNDGSGLFTFTPTVNDRGSYSNIKVVVIDQLGGKDSIHYTLHVDSMLPPDIEPITPIQLYTFNMGLDTLMLANPSSDYPVKWTLIGKPGFVDTVTLDQGQLLLKMFPGAADTGSYSFTAYASNAFGSNDSIVVPIRVDYRSLKSWYLNFATNYSWMPYPTSPWNNIYSDTAINLKDDQGHVSALGLELHTDWWKVYSNGPKTGNNSGLYPDPVLRDHYFFGILGGPQQVNGAVTGLDPAKTYSITFFASTVWPISQDNGHTVFQVGNQSGSIHVQDNTQDALTFSYLKPSTEGEIPFTLKKGADAAAGFLNAMIITAEASIPPTKPSNLHLENTSVNGKNAIELSWQKGSNNVDAFYVYRSMSKDGSYNLLNPQGKNGYLNNYKDTNVSLSRQTYYYYLVAINDYGTSETTDTMSITTTQYVDDRSWYINFATNYGWMSYPDQPWNNITQDTVTNLKDDEGNSSNIGIELHTDWWKVYNNGPQTGNGSGLYPDPVIRDHYFFGILGGPQQVTGAITGLDPKKTYNITFFASSAWQISNDNGHTVFQIGIRKDSIHVQNNINKTVTFSTLQPSEEGKIVFTLQKGADAAAGFLNAMVVQTNKESAPLKPINIDLASKTIGGGNAIQVNWELQSQNATSIEVYRSSNSSSGYTVLNPGVLNGFKTSYTDSTVTSGNTYYYYIVATNPYGSSASSDTVSMTTPNYVDTREWYINLSTNYGWMRYPTAPWNNIHSDTTVNLVDQLGNTSQVGLELHTNWWKVYTNGPKTGNDAGIYPDPVLRDHYLFGILGGPETVSGSVTGLDTAKTYNITFFASSVWVAGHGHTVFQIDSMRDSINVQNNLTQTITFNGIKSGKYGKIDFTASKGTDAVAGFMNAIVVSTDSDIPPYSPVNFQLEEIIFNNKTALKINWQEGSNNTDSVKLFKATKNGNYTLIFTGSRDRHEYIDTLVTVNNNYKYYLVAANAFGPSIPSDTVSINVRSLFPVRPTDLTLKDIPSVNRHMVEISWSQSLNDTIMIYRSTQKESAYTLLAKVREQDNPVTYTDSTSRSATTYYYYLVAANSLGISTPSDTVAITTGSPVPQPSIEMVQDVFVSGGETDTVQVYVTGVDSSITFSVVRMPSFMHLMASTDSSISIILTPDSTEVGYYDSIEIIATTRDGRADSGYLNIYVTEGGVFEELYLNFSGSGRGYFQSYWNNLYFSNVPNYQYVGLKNPYGQASYITVTAVNAWSGSADYGASTYNNSGFVPDSVMSTYFYINDGNSRILKISGLDTSRVYNFIFFGSSNYGGNKDYTTHYAINGDTVVLDGIHNTSESVRINGVRPNNNGVAIISIAKDTHASSGILNALIIESYKTLLPSPAQLKAIAVDDGVQLTWSVRSKKEQEFQVWRAGALSGPYTNIGTVTNNRYKDLNVTPNTRYFYKVMALGDHVSSLSSNIASATTFDLSVYINFNWQETPANLPWNNTQTVPQDGDVYGPFRDSKGNSTGITIHMFNNFPAEGNSGFDPEEQSGIYPSTVIQSMYYVDKGPDTIVMKLDNLDLSKKYDLTFFGSVSIFGWQNTTQFFVNDKVAALETSFNLDHTATIYQVSPDKYGQITIRIICTPESQYIILNALVVRQYSNYDNNGNEVIDPDLYLRKFDNKDDYEQNLNNSSGTGLVLVQSAYPNPFKQIVNLEINSAQSGTLLMHLYDVNGKLVEQKEKYIVSGLNRIQFETRRGIAPGVYILTLRLPYADEAVSIKLIKRP